MPASIMLNPLVRYMWNSTWLYNAKIFIALCGTAAVPWFLGEVKLTISLTLGVIAGALADFEDGLIGRLRNLGITLVCFFIASTAVEILFPWPWLFGLGLLVSTSGFILLGGLIPRYSSITFGALLIAIYTMLGISLYEKWYQQPVLLLLGVIWYNLLTLTGYLLFPMRSLQDNLANSYKQLAHYLELKSQLFNPDIEADSQTPLYDLVFVNAKLVSTLNQTKISLHTCLHRNHGQRVRYKILHYYFIAQDIHERARASHIQYASLREKLHYSDIMFRFQRLLLMQAQACQKVAHAILFWVPYQHDACFKRIFNHLDASLECIQGTGTLPLEQIEALVLLLNNLRAIDAQLATIESEDAIQMSGNDPNNRLSEDNPCDAADIWLRLNQNFFTLESALFRHAIRMSIVLCVGYAFIQIIDLHHGYWILLTSLLVCQPNYSATRHRLTLRVIGTLVGVAIGLPLLYFVPSVEGELILIVIAGVLFFTFCNIQYAHATMFITLLVLLCFNLLGKGFEVALPRIIDTLIGCAIAWAGVSFIWPDWHFWNIPQLLDQTINANCRYLSAVLEQYHHGRDNRLAYRIARRGSHNPDAELASVALNISTEPRVPAEIRKVLFHLLYLNHTFISYISTLGAHREKLSNPEILTLLNDVICYIDDALHYRLTDEAHTQQIFDQLMKRIGYVNLDSNGKILLIIQQASLLSDLLPEIGRLQQQISGIYRKAGSLH